MKRIWTRSPHTSRHFDESKGIVMASETIALSAVDQGPISERLHDWVVTVDHKRLGILYILYALLFLVNGGVEATLMRLQLIVPNYQFVSPEHFHRTFNMHMATIT